MNYYGQETERALGNFPFTYHEVFPLYVHYMVLVKKAAALANKESKGLDRDIADAIVFACDELLAGKYSDQFVVNALQGGAGTSLNMNVNEVIASLATEYLHNQGKEVTVHPLDHVNKSQSTNDVNPSAAKLTCYQLIEQLNQTVESLIHALGEKEEAWKEVHKLGRTHLQDAIPMTVGQEFGGYKATLIRDHHRLQEMVPYFLELNLGGTAIGTMLNASPEYQTNIYSILSELSHYPVKPSQNFISQTNSQSDFVHLSGVITVLMTDMSKISNDIRLLSSGPKGGIGELKLPELQKGSSIMPGKVNPVVCEIVNQTSFLISGYHVTIIRATEAAQLELGVMFPILIDTLLQSLILSQEVIQKFTTAVIIPLEVNRERCKELLEQSTAYATVLSPLLGHDVMSGIVQESITTNKPIIDLLKEKKLYSQEIERLLS